ncbi:hypothetical protein HBA54_03260 [Pelagibius litoralis]|uniref:Uncharacterized protein n=1 Tax=Pelagibius litoralis TaxID=374515 RepID=A0A967C572_9PROT|nr:hypothetical protein [Pelagibius litoralis]NIA67601.1 hypothetical protein [Pelagibius litoralis]
MKIERDGNGAWKVVDDSGATMAGNLTNAQAWRWFDQHDTHAADDENRRRRISTAVAER